MSSKLKIRPKIRRVCRKCGARLVNKPEYGAVCPECGWYRVSYTDKEKKKMSDLISRQDAIDAIRGEIEVNGYSHVADVLEQMPSAQPDIKQAAKLLSDFIESCPGGDSYLITPDGEELRTDWGYAMEGIQLIHDWAERKTDG